MRFIHAADIHLDSPLHGLERYPGAPVDQIRSATRRAFDNLIGLAEAEQASFLLLAGDLYDGDWRDYNTGLYFSTRMERLREAGVRVFMVAGNHDAASQITRHLRLPDNVRMLSSKSPETVLLNDLDVAIHGQGYATRSVTADLSLAYPQGDPGYFNIGLLHTSLDGRPGHDNYAPSTLDGLRSKGYQYWALGHIHQREVISREPWIVYPGNIQGRYVGESGPKGCTLVQAEDGAVESVEHRELDVMRWEVCRVDIAGSDTVDHLYQRVAGEFEQLVEGCAGRPVAVRLLLHGAGAAHSALHADREHWIQQYRVLANGIEGAGVWLEKVVVQTRTAMSIDEALQRDTALGGLLQVVQDLSIDDAAVSGLAGEVAGLRHKLPPELLGGSDPYDPTDPAQIRAQLEGIKALLIHRLLAMDHQS